MVRAVLSRRRSAFTVKAGVGPLVIMLFAVIAPVVVQGLATPAGAVSGNALIDASGVSGSPSVEQTVATSLCLSVTIVSASAWNAMTASDFAKYTVLIIGDATCNGVAPSVTSNRATWTSAVMATAAATPPWATESCGAPTPVT